MFKPQVERMLYQVPQLTHQQTQANPPSTVCEQAREAGKNKVKRVCMRMRVCAEYTSSS